MFARRVFEVLASNTILISNYSRAIKMLLGDLVFCADDAAIIIQSLIALEDSKNTERHKLIALRKVLQEHTYTKRANFIVDKVFGIELTNKKSILVVAFIEHIEDANQIIKFFKNQILENKELLLVDLTGNNFQIDNYLILRTLEDLQQYLSVNSSIDYVAYFSKNNYYGKNYLLDLYLATFYSSAQIIGKSKRYIVDDETLSLSDGLTYSQNANIPLFASIVTKDKFIELLKNKKQLPLELDSICFQDDVLSINYFDYCENYKKLAVWNSEEVDSDLNIDTGLAFKDYEILSYSNADVDFGSDFDKDIPAEKLGRFFTKPKGKNFDFEYVEGGIRVVSNLPTGKHDYYYCTKPISIDELNFLVGVKQKIYLDTEVGLNIQMVVKYFDVEHNNLGHEMIVAMKNSEILIPREAHYVSLGFRLYGSGQTIIKSLMLRHKIHDPSFVLSPKKYLLISNQYPEYNDLYKNAFVHSRILAYKELGLDMEVFRLRDSQVSYHEFEGINVVTGSKQLLHKMIKNNDFDTIVVHFLDSNMWETLKDFISNHRIIVWVHGSEIQSWKRREFLYVSDDDKKRANDAYQQRANMWREIIGNMPKNLHFVFVSQYFADEVMQDLEVNIPKNQYSVISNPIDTEKFSYTQKDLHLRKKILSIRPFASKTYANDLTVKAILQLSKKSFFKDLEFRIIGDGPLFDETVAPLKEFSNVILEKRFLRQDEISKLHKEYGVFLCPSRMDTQGVSRDEAMSSGLIPITNSVGAIPEFLAEFQDLLSDPEDVDGLVQKITDIYNNPSLFDRLSLKVSDSIKNRAKSQIVQQEVQLIRG